MPLNMKIDEVALMKSISEVTVATRAMTLELRERLPVETALEVVDAIRSRTGRGVDIDDNAFEGYAASTKAGSWPSGPKSNPVSLNDTGAMMNAIQVRKGSGGGTEIGFRNSAQAVKARAHQFGVAASEKAIGGRLPARPWFGVSPKDSRAIAQKISPTASRAITGNRRNGYVVEGKGFEADERTLLVVDNP